MWPDVDPGEERAAEVRPSSRVPALMFLSDGASGCVIAPAEPNRVLLKVIDAAGTSTSEGAPDTEAAEVLWLYREISGRARMLRQSPLSWATVADVRLQARYGDTELPETHDIQGKLWASRGGARVSLQGYTKDEILNNFASPTFGGFHATGLTFGSQ